jgi:hypothetical protein
VGALLLSHTAALKNTFERHHVLAFKETEMMSFKVAAIIMGNAFCC